MSTEQTDILEVHNLTVSYQLKPVLWNIDFSIPAGSMTAIVGPNGAGKSTLLKSILGLTETNSGYVRLFGKTTDEVRHRISYIPQRESVDWDFPATVKDIAEMGRYVRKGLLGRLTKADKDIAMESLKKVNMESYSSRQISKLSGGQQQRTFIARALAEESELYFMDEPFAGVDISTEKMLVELFHGMRDSGKTLVVVHHDLNTVPDYFDRVVMINTRLIGSGKVEDVFQPEVIRETYGGKLTILNNVVDVMGRGGYPVRDERRRGR